MRYLNYDYDPEPENEDNEDYSQINSDSPFGVWD